MQTERSRADDHFQLTGSKKIRVNVVKLVVHQHSITSTSTSVDSEMNRNKLDDSPSFLARLPPFDDKSGEFSQTDFTVEGRWKINFYVNFKGSQI